LLDFLILKMEMIDCFETSVRNYHSTLYKILEQRRLLKCINYTEKEHNLNYEAGGTRQYNCPVKVNYSRIRLNKNFFRDVKDLQGAIK